MAKMNRKAGWGGGWGRVCTLEATQEKVTLGFQVALPGPQRTMPKGPST